ncbi:A disintegrin and metalloproteinase with thrombospondin motifs 16-like [Glandiceps talaboti]
MTGPTVLTLIVCCLLFVITSSRSIDKVHLSMSEHELKYHFGVTSHADVPEYYVTSPKELKSDITKRSIGIQTFDVQFSVDIFGDSLQLQLMKNIDLLVPNFVVQRIGANYTSTYSFPRDHCCYHGDVKNNEASNVAVCTCDGLNGIIKHNGDDFMIQPLHEHDGQRMRRSAGNVHIVTKRSVDENTNVCGTRDVARSSLQDNVIRNLQVRQDIDSPKHMETLVVTEKSMHEYHGDALEQYILTLMNVVAGRFKDGSLGADFTVHLARLMILETSQTDLVVTTDSTATLSSFCSWQRGVNVDDDTDPLHHDEALLITRHDLHSEGNSGVIGKAYIGGTCNPGLQCAINEDTGFGTALTITHEVGHNLGINHDNYGNSCPNGVNIMATSSVQGSGAFEWSTCSAQQLDDFLNTVGSSCLDDNPSANDVIDIDSDFHPGEIYSADQQCKLAYGGESVACTFKVDVCEALWCQASATSGGCSTQYTPKMDGTECGTGMWCMRATCVEYGDEGPDAIDGGFSAWDTTWSECSRTCGGGVAIKRRYCTNPEPMFGGAPCSGPDAQYQLCNTEDCSASQADFIAQQCAQFDSQPFNGALYTWVPYYNVGEDDLCRLPCYAESGNFYVYYNQMVDGSRCSFGVNQKVCIDQSCESFGCDNVHNSEAILDRCGVCDGDGDTCEIVSGSYSDGTTQQYSTVVTIPVGATSVTVTESNYWCHLAVKVDGNYVISGDGNRASTGQYSHNGNTMELQSTGQLETLTVGGPLTFEIELLVRYIVSIAALSTQESTLTSTMNIISQHLGK